MAHSPTCWAALGFVPLHQSLRDTIWLPGMFLCRIWFAAQKLWLAEAAEQLPPVLECPGVTNGSDSTRVSPAHTSAQSMENAFVFLVVLPQGLHCPSGMGEGRALPGFLESPIVGWRDRWGWQWEPGCFSWHLLGRDQPGSCLSCLHCCTGPRDGQARRSLPSG